MSNKQKNKAKVKRALYNKDGWTNAIAGIGKARDKSKHTFFGDYIMLNDTELAHLYTGNGLGRKIMDVIADDMTSKWIIPNIEEGQKPKDDPIWAELNRLTAQTSFNEAIKWQRLFGGSIILIGARDGRKLDQPLGNVRAIDWLKVYDKTQIFLESGSFIKDPKDPDFGQLTHFQIQADNFIADTFKVHSSRTLQFFGDSLPRITKQADIDLMYWGASALQAVFEALKDYGATMRSVANLMYEFIIGKYKFNNLRDMLQRGNESKLLNRMEVIDMSKSIINAVLLGEGEEYSRDTANMSGLGEVIDRFQTNLAAFTGYPVTKLFGKSPAGLNATGDGDLNNYYDRVKSKQELDVRPPLQRLVDMIGNYIPIPENWSLAFAPLRLPSPKDQAEIDNKNANTEKLHAETDQLYIDMGVLEADDIIEKRGFAPVSDFTTQSEGEEDD